MANETPREDARKTVDDMKRSSQVLKEKIEELRKKTEMPLNSSLGDPKIDAENADGRRDLPEEDDD